METQVTEIADKIYRLSTHIPHAGPGGFTFNQFLIDAEQPLLFHTGLRNIFPLVSAAIERVMPLDRLRWITFGHYEADECGAMNEFLARAPQATVAHGQMGVILSLMDQCDREPRALNDGETVDLGGRRVRWLQTPHVPHGWDAGLIYEETTNTLFAGDLFTIGGKYPELIESDLMERATAFETSFPGTALTPATQPTIERLAELQPATLALMHNSAWKGDGASALRNLAAWYGERLQQQLASTA
jgi:flavorubredoxin